MYVLTQVLTKQVELYVQCPLYEVLLYTGVCGVLTKLSGLNSLVRILK